jgi:nicotinamidase-related amidase
MRHSRILRRQDSILLVVDFQEKLLASFKKPDALVQSCLKLIKFAKILKLPIIWTEQYPKGLGETVDEIKVELSHLEPVEKLTFSCFGEPGFVESLSRHEGRQIMVCGIETHICVGQTVLDAIACGYQAHVVTDACGSRKKSDHKAGLRKMEGSGAVLTCVESAMYEILERSDTAEFRDVLKIVK